MNPESFFDNFELLAESPNGIKKLREMILQMAVQGKLVEQKSDDEQAGILLKRIKAEKKRLVKEGHIKKSKTLPAIDKNEIPYDLPAKWVWTKFDDICSYIQRGKGPKYTDISDIPVISQKCVQWDGFKIERARFIDSSTLDKYVEERFLRTGDILWNSTGTGTIGRVNIYVHENNPYEKVVVDSHVTVVRPICIDSHFIYCWVANPLVQNKIENNASGSTNQIELATSTVKNHLIPLPPLEEQKRIVDKVDQLMALCDQLESFQQKKNESRIQLNNSALNKMLDAGSSEEFAEHWQLVCENFDLLYDDLDNVEKLKQAILQLAVQGKLVEQDVNDEPAEVLLEKIKAEKERLVKEKKIKKIDTLNSISSDNILFELPLGWTWVRIGDIVKKLGAGSTPKGGKSVYQDEGIKFIRSQNVWNEGLKLQNVALISLEIHTKMKGTVVYPGDILLNITGASIGRSSVVPDEFDEGNVSQHVSILRLIDNDIRKFIHTCIVSPLVQDAIMDAQVGISREGLSISNLKNFVIPLPPLEEQKRIVAKVDQLMTLCDQLEAKIKQARSDSDVLMEVAVNHLLEV